MELDAPWSEPSDLERGEQAEHQACHQQHHHFCTGCNAPHAGLQAPPAAGTAVYMINCPLDMVLSQQDVSDLVQQLPMLSGDVSHRYGELYDRWVRQDDETKAQPAASDRQCTLPAWSLETVDPPGGSNPSNPRPAPRPLLPSLPAQQVLRARARHAGRQHSQRRLPGGGRGLLHQRAPGPAPALRLGCAPPIIGPNPSIQPAACTTRRPYPR